MPADSPPRKVVDFDAIQRQLAGRCFICELLGGNPEYAHHIVYEDHDFVAFLNKYPSLYGHTLVAPREHREHVTGDFTVDEYLALQATIHRIGEAIRRTVPTERLYVMSIGSQQANAHVHWHIAPLPPGVPLAKQQFAALTDDVQDLGEEELLDLARRLRAAISST